MLAGDETRRNGTNPGNDDRHEEASEKKLQSHRQLLPLESSLKQLTSYSARMKPTRSLLDRRHLELSCGLAASAATLARLFLRGFGEQKRRAAYLRAGNQRKF